MPGLAGGLAVSGLLGAACASEPVVTAVPRPVGAERPASTPEPETLFPLSGNAGYDVERYDVDLAYDPATGTLNGVVNLTAVAATALDAITLDLGVMALDAATVDGVAAAAELAGGKLRLTPPSPLASGARFVLGIAYHGVPQHRADPTLGTPLGWISTASGSYTRNEPNGASTWLPSNDHPSDKAAYRVRVSVPEPLFAVVNGAAVGEERTGGRVATTWETTLPMAASELQIAVGNLARVDTTTPGGAPLSSYVAANGMDVAPGLGLAGRMVDFYSTLFGPYPFPGAGLIAADAPTGTTVAAQGRPLVSAVDLTAPTGVRQHHLLSTALAHQWFGSAVTPARWQDVWLSEAFSTYARWLWMQKAGMQSVDDAAANALTRADSLRAAFGTPDHPGASTLFSPTVADGGAVALHALRKSVGDRTFFAILKTWVAKYAGQSVTTEAFIDHASEIAGEDLTGLFLDWLSAEDVPEDYPQPSG